MKEFEVCTCETPYYKYIYLKETNFKYCLKCKKWKEGYCIQGIHCPICEKKPIKPLLEENSKPPFKFCHCINPKTVLGSSYCEDYCDNCNKWFQQRCGCNFCMNRPARPIS